MIVTNKRINFTTNYANSVKQFLSNLIKFTNQPNYLKTINIVTRWKKIKQMETNYLEIAVFLNQKCQLISILKRKQT